MSVLTTACARAIHVETKNIKYFNKKKKMSRRLLKHPEEKTHPASTQRLDPRSHRRRPPKTWKSSTAQVAGRG